MVCVSVAVMLPVEVAPSVPCVAALASPAVATANDAASAILVKSEDMIADPRFELGLGNRRIDRSGNPGSMISAPSIG